VQEGGRLPHRCERSCFYRAIPLGQAARRHSSSAIEQAFTGQGYGTREELIAGGKFSFIGGGMAVAWHGPWTVWIEAGRSGCGDFASYWFKPSHYDEEATSSMARSPIPSNSLASLVRPCQGLRPNAGARRRCHLDIRAFDETNTARSAGPSSALIKAADFGS